MYSSSQQNGDVSVLFRSVQMEAKRPFHAQQMEVERGTAMGKRPNVQLTTPIIASTKKMPGESKKAKRSIALPKRSYLEAI